MTGWIKLHRKLKEKAYYNKDSEKVHLWIHILLCANHAGKEEMLGGKPIYCEPGQFTAGRKQLSTETGISESKIQRILTYFDKIEHQIEQQTTNTNRLITVLNWEEYQILEQQSEQQLNNERTTTEQQLNNNRTHLKNVKKEKNVNNKKSKEKDILAFDQFRILYLGKKRGLETEFENFTKKTKDWKEVLPVLKPAIENQISIRSQKIAATQFVPQWKNLQTWINQRCWEEIETSIQSNLLDNGLAD